VTADARLTPIARLDADPPEVAAAALAPLFEGATRFLDRLVATRPFGTRDRLFQEARAIAHAMPEADQIELVDAHPRLGAARELVSALSATEQGYDRPRAAQPPTALEALNDAYEARFCFRYCVFVAGRPLDALVPELEAELGAHRDAELHRALDAVIDIAIARQRAASEAGNAGEASAR